MSRRMIVQVLLLCLFATAARGQGPVIELLQGNGRLIWTNSVRTNAIYRVEWAAQADGPWHSFTYQPLNTVDAHEGTSFEVEVPMFYRVVMTTNPPPAGMAWIDGGDVELGWSGDSGPSPASVVRTNFISGFWMDEMEVSKGMWDDVFAWATNHGYAFENAGSGKTNNHPVQEVMWHDCVKWCNARSQKEGLKPCYYIGADLGLVYTQGILDVSNDWVDWSANGYRLPTSAEWEKAARGGRHRRLFPWGGDTIEHRYANYYSDHVWPYDVSPTPGNHPDHNDGVWPYTSPVGSFPANGYGLHDMDGNVFEWCWDWSGAEITDYQVDPRGPASGTYRVLRGGSWNYEAEYARCARWTSIWGTGLEPSSLGFRCVKGR